MFRGIDLFLLENVDGDVNAMYGESSALQPHYIREHRFRPQAAYNE